MQADDGKRIEDGEERRGGAAGWRGSACARATGKRTELLDQLLVLVELLEALHVHRLNVGLLGLVDVLGITQDAHLHARARHMRKLDRAVETLVLLGIVVLQAYEAKADRYLWRPTQSREKSCMPYRSEAQRSP